MRGLTARSGVFSPDGKLLATGDRDVTLLEIPSWKKKQISRGALASDSFDRVLARWCGIGEQRQR